MNKQSKKATLLLGNGMIFEGKSLGACGNTIGEAVFTTGMTAYQETITDPTCFGQIIVQTFPLIGNYGVNKEDSQSDKPCLKGYVVREACDAPSNFRCEGTLDDFLKTNNIIGICDIDTRRLTRVLRENGTMNAMITTQEITDKELLLKKINEFEIKDAIKTVSCEKAFTAKVENAKYEVLLFDFGQKNDMVEQLNKRGCAVTVVPYNATAKEVIGYNPNGIVLSDGPGDPAQNLEILDNLREIIKLDIPMFGVGLGHQLVALAMGFKTYKLKHGHRGASQPVFDKSCDRTYITKQNHGYAVLSDSIDEKIATVTHVNSNDHTCEGLSYKAMSIDTVQFHPETRGGPQDLSYLFDNFINRVEKAKNK